jgi:hypothetical protein
MSVLGPPTGLEIALPSPWKVARTAEPINRHAGIDPAQVGLATSYQRLADIGHGGPSPHLVAELHDTLGGTAVDAEFELSIYAIDVPTDPRSIQAALGDSRGATTVVSLPGGEAVLVMGRLGGRIDHRYYLPVPDTPGEVAFFSFTSPDVEAEDELRPLFDEVASGITFTWAPGAVQALSTTEGGPQVKTIGILLLVFLLAVVFNSSLSLGTKAPVLVTGALGSLLVAMSLARRGGWAPVAAAGAVLAVVYLGAVATASG